MTCSQYSYSLMGLRSGWCTQSILPRCSSSGAQGDPRTAPFEHALHSLDDLLHRHLRPFAVLMHATDGGGTGMIELRTPAPLAVGVPPIGAIGRKGVQAGARPFTNQMNHHLRLQQLPDMIAGPHAAIVDDYVPGPHLTPQYP